MKAYTLIACQSKTTHPDYEWNRPLNLRSVRTEMNAQEKPQQRIANISFQQAIQIHVASFDDAVGNKRLFSRNREKHTAASASQVIFYHFCEL